MTDPADLPVFDESSDTVRFWVTVGDQVLGASIGRLALHHLYRPSLQDDKPLDTFLANRAAIEDAVRKRYAQGSREPVMLREYDLRA